MLTRQTTGQPNGGGQHPMAALIINYEMDEQENGKRIHPMYAVAPDMTKQGFNDQAPLSEPNASRMFDKH